MKPIDDIMNNLRLRDFLKQIGCNIKETVEWTVKNSKKKDDADKIYDECKVRTWKYMFKKYVNVDKKDVYFYNLDNRVGVYAMCIREGTVDKNNQKYCVTFAFLHPDDVFCTRNKYKNIKYHYRPYVIANYHNSKYTYRDIVATSPINAVCLACNKNSFGFPSKKKDMKVKPRAFSTHPFKNCYIVDFSMFDEGSVLPLSTKDKELYFGYRKEFLSKHPEFRNNLRYYFIHGGRNSAAAMVVKKGDRFSVTFTFINGKDCVPITSIGFKYHLYKNYEAGKYTYENDDTTNSLNSVVRQFNAHCYKEFPSMWKENKMSIELMCDYAKDDDLFGNCYTAKK